jgi:hypothetical protein
MIRIHSFKRRIAEVLGLERSYLARFVRFRSVNQTHQIHKVPRMFVRSGNVATGE